WRWSARRSPTCRGSSATAGPRPKAPSGTRASRSPRKRGRAPSSKKAASCNRTP
ncbi:MAG: hypothetical protein AVDCRST_MAG05-2883, partial [uncultured Rubrobacteraceae bacterium]